MTLMRILLTGACGTLGRAIRQLEEARQHTFVLFDTAEQVLADGGVRASIADRDAVRRAAEGCDAVIHTAAMHGAFFGKASNAEFIATNVLGAEYLFAAAIEHGVRRLAMASSMEVLIGRDWDAYGTAVVDETLAPRPDWIYPVTKRQVEVLGSFYAQHHGLENVQLRYMGFSDAPVRKLGMLLLARYVTAADAARATLLAATVPGVRDEILHIGPDTPLTQRDTNDAQADPAGVLERRWPGSVDVLRKHDVPLRADLFWPVTRIDRARRVLGWQPRDTFELFLRELGWSRPS
jgi:nucleoside-diphosphate-sugar epimerase